MYRLSALPAFMVVVAAVLVLPWQTTALSIQNDNDDILKRRDVAAVLTRIAGPFEMKKVGINQLLDKDLNDLFDHITDITVETEATRATLAPAARTSMRVSYFLDELFSRCSSLSVGDSSSSSQEEEADTVDHALPHIHHDHGETVALPFVPTVVSPEIISSLLEQYGNEKLVRLGDLLEVFSTLAQGIGQQHFSRASGMYPKIRAAHAHLDHSDLALSHTTKSASGLQLYLDQIKAATSLLHGQDC